MLGHLNKYFHKIIKEEKSRKNKNEEDNIKKCG